ncbi:MAG: LON peptidase substrate-binding domain-containing protein [Chitinophagaceae bacterium]|nr:LON peptidase substrate-binding domain-containing protein [Chitinophagaceae bacterium]
MTNFIPIFPLGIVVYPSETVSLHIFEPRYKQLISDCRAANKDFGIPVVINNVLQEMGTLVTISEIVNEYPNGEMDIRIRGVKIFRKLELITSVPDKLYSGAIVTYPDNIEDEGNIRLMQSVIKGIKEVHRLLEIKKEFKKPDEQLISYDVAHHAGLSIDEEYELLGLMMELQRQEYLKRHLQKVLPLLLEMEQLKQKVKLNGHFRNLSSLDLNIDPQIPE